MKKVSIIILTFNKLDYTKRCLKSLKENTRTSLVSEVIVVDNNSTDGTAEYLKKINWIKPVINKKNQGFAKGCNQGARLAKGEILLFLNNDTELIKGWLEPLVKVIEKEKNIGAVGSKLLFPNKKVQHAGVAIFASKVPEHLYAYEDSNKPYINRKKNLNAVTAACVAIPKNIFQELNGFDELYINGYEDIDLFLRMRQLGYKVVYEPESVLIHNESVSFGRHAHNFYNIELYMNRWGNIPSDAHKIMQADGLNSIQILINDIKGMAFAPTIYGDIPLKVLFLRKFYKVFTRLRKKR